MERSFHNRLSTGSWSASGNASTLSPAVHLDESTSELPNPDLIFLSTVCGRSGRVRWCARCGAARRPYSGAFASLRPTCSPCHCSSTLLRPQPRPRCADHDPERSLPRHLVTDCAVSLFVIADGSVRAGGANESRYCKGAHGHPGGARSPAGAPNAAQGIHLSCLSSPQCRRQLLPCLGSNTWRSGRGYRCVHPPGSG